MVDLFEANVELNSSWSSTPQTNRYVNQAKLRKAIKITKQGRAEIFLVEVSSSHMRAFFFIYVLVRHNE